MKRLLKVLILEDVQSDAELMVHELKQAGFSPDWRRVDTKEQYLSALESNPDIPFVVISGAITEDVAVEFMKQGASDYLFKDHMARLGRAVVRALEQRELREEKRRTEEALQESEVLYRAVVGQAFHIIFLVDLNTKSIVDGNIAFQECSG